MAFEKLTSREKEVLQNLIDHYIQTADPVGSRVIANKYGMGVSPATIRNTMQDLEEMGLIAQPHTSAGRIPTDTGYRIFVDMLLQQEQLTKAEKKKIDKFIATTIGKSIDTVLGQASKVLGEITNQLGLTIGPKFERGVLRRMDLIPVAEGKLLAILSVESGLARSILIELESQISDKDLIQLEAVLNERLAGLPLGQIRKTIRERLSDTPCNPKLIKLFISPDQAIWTASDPKIIYLKGTDNLLAQPEFSDRNKLLGFLKFLEEKEELVNLLESRTLGEGIVITIGTESAIDQIQNCSLVTTRYKAGKMTGAIGIIGPTRMQYSKLISIVDYTARSLTEALSEL